MTDDVVAVEVDGDDTIDIPDIKSNLTDFRNMAIFTHIDLIEEPEFTTRYIEESHVQKLKKQFKDRGYNASSGVLSVALPARSLHEANNLTAGEEISFKTMLVDGRHRLRALKELREEDEVWKERTNRLEVGVFIHREGFPIDNFMIISLGQQMNSSSNVNLPTTFRARIHAGISCLMSLARTVNRDVRQLPFTKCWRRLCSGDCVGKLADRTVRRYTAICLRLAPSPDLTEFVYELCKTYDFLGLVHFDSPYLLSSGDRKFRFCLEELDQLASRQVPKEGEARPRINFAEMRDSFYETAGVLFDMVLRFSSRNNMAVEDVLSAMTAASKGQCIRSIREHILISFLRFQYCQNSADALKRRKDRLRGILLGFRPDDPGTPVCPAEPPEVIEVDPPEEQDPPVTAPPETEQGQGNAQKNGDQKGDDESQQSSTTNQPNNAGITAGTGSSSRTRITAFPFSSCTHSKPPSTARAVS